MTMGLTLAPVAPGEELLRIEGLGMSVPAGGLRLVDGVSLSVAAGQVAGIVGESGSGKTLTAKAVVRLQPQPIHIDAGRILYRGVETTGLPAASLRRLRGAEIGMVFQEPMTSLNPSMTIGRQLDEGLRIHGHGTPAERRAAILEMLGRVGIADPEAALKAFPHRFSGGMRQRIMIASVLLPKPRLVLADEPTTALDAMIQRDVLELMLDLARDNGTAVLLISHDLPMMARYADHLVVMEKGKVVESGATGEVLARPQHPYTRKLLSTLPRRLPERPMSDAPPIVEVRGLRKSFEVRSLWHRTARIEVLKGIDLTIRPREVVALVGGSGSGKTTLGRIIAGLTPPGSGEVRFAGQPIDRGTAGYRNFRHNCQFIYQDPYSSLNPRMTVGALVAEGLRHEPGLTAGAVHDRMIAMLEDVGLTAAHAARYPHEMSGGQRQRVAIGRALIRRPAFVIADEPVSALDTTVRAQVLDLIAGLQQQHGFACLFISHDLAVVEQIADRVIVMTGGEIVEQGPKARVFDAPQSDYTRRLLSAIPVLTRNAAGGVEMSWRATPA